MSRHDDVCDAGRRAVIFDMAAHVIFVTCLDAVKAVCWPCAVCCRLTCHVSLDV
jgi:hypothetical protein